jgi:hypothetical protein
MMTDADGLLAARFAATRDDHDDSHWNDVLRRASQRPTLKRRSRTVLVAMTAFAAVALPTLALSASAREFIGLGNGPSPDYHHARLAVDTAISGGRVARVWVGPSTQGGECSFVTIAPAASKPSPLLMNGGGECTTGQERFRGRLSWSFSKGRHDVPIIHGRVSPTLNSRRVELRWHGGSQRLVYRNGYFIAESSALAIPPFRQLPYDVIAYNAFGRIVVKSRIPTSFLYLDWKRVQPRLHRYRVAHGCDTTIIWRCKSR